MADELSISTTNQAGDGWVDQVPGPVSSGYQAQNTIISSTLIGIDKSEVRPSTGGAVIVEPSGPIDVDGQPYMVTSRLSLRPPNPSSAGGYYYIKVATGSVWNKKTLVTVTSADPPTYDYAKRGLYFVDSAGVRERCLNWIVYYPSSTIDREARSRPHRIIQPKRPRLRIENFLNINGTATNWNFQFRAGDVVLFGLNTDNRGYNYSGDYHGHRTEEAFRRPLGEAGGTLRIKFTLSVPNSNLRWYEYSIRETTAINGDGTIKASGRTHEPNGNRTLNVSEDISFAPLSRISLFFKVAYRGDGERKHIDITNFTVSASQEVSPLMRRMLVIPQQFFTVNPAGNFGGPPW